MYANLNTNLMYFLISFCVGMFIVYISTPLPEIIIKYPNPMNSGKIIYKDLSDMCYVYDKREETCNDKSINTPIQSKNRIENKNGLPFWGQ